MIILGKIPFFVKGNTGFIEEKMLSSTKTVSGKYLLTFQQVCVIVSSVVEISTK